MKIFTEETFGLLTDLREPTSELLAHRSLTGSILGGEKTNAFRWLRSFSGEKSKSRQLLVNVWQIRPSIRLDRVLSTPTRPFDI